MNVLRKQQICLLAVALVLLVLTAALVAVQPASAQLSVSETKLTATDAATNDKFGISVSIDGDTIIVGAIETPGFRPGSAYVFQRSGTTWNQQAKLTASDGAADDVFGRRTSISGDTIVVGAQLDDDAGDKSGSVYVFQQSGMTWSQQAKLTASDAESGANFGVSVSIDGDTIVVGANYISKADPGSAYVFQRSGTTWTQQAKLTASDGAGGDEFGGSVSIDGDTVVVGSRRDDEGPFTDIGSAYMFQRSGTTWTQQAKLTVSDGGTFSLLGTSVSIDGDTVLVGAVYDEVAGSNKGSAYIFQRSGTIWSQQAKLTASDGAHGDEFGGEASLGGDIAVISARFDDDAGSQSGSAYIFERSGTSWSQQAKLTASDAAASDLFGYGVSISGNTVVVGAGNQTNDGGAEAGAAYVFELAPSNQPPSVATDQPTVEVDEGITTSNTGTVSDSDGDEVTLTASVGMVTNNNDGTWSWSFTTSDGPTQSQMVTIDADDGNGGTAQTNFLLTVNNVAPTVDVIAVPLAPVAVSAQPVSASATFSDPANTSDEPYTCTMNYGEGDTPPDEPGTVTGAVCDGPAHTYAEPGVYSVSVTVTDKDGASGSAAATDFIVIYDLDGGFVTGGGWIDSPADACTTFCGGATGKANFGFVSKYKKGQSVPSGNTEFNFSAGGLNFHSDSYDWLVINQGSTNAQYKGSGTINGDLAPNGEAFRFTIWAKDLDPGSDDTFRIKIWYEDGSEVGVYDNGFDRPIGGGNIKIHD